MKYSLRSLFVVVTLSGAILGRVAYLKRMADSHHEKALNYFFESESIKLSDGLRLSDPEFCRLSSLFCRHEDLSEAYDKALWRPWTIVSEPPENRP